MDVKFLTDMFVPNKFSVKLFEVLSSLETEVIPQITHRMNKGIESFSLMLTMKNGVELDIHLNPARTPFWKKPGSQIRSTIGWGLGNSGHMFHYESEHRGIKILPRIQKAINIANAGKPLTKDNFAKNSFWEDEFLP